MRTPPTATTEMPVIPILAHGPSSPRARSDLVREEQAFYEAHANAQPWKTAVRRISPVLVFILFTTLLGLFLPLR